MKKKHSKAIFYVNIFYNLAKLLPLIKDIHLFIVLHILCSENSQRGEILFAGAFSY